jgi:hypothetical protein
MSCHFFETDILADEKEATRSKDLVRRKCRKLLLTRYRYNEAEALLVCNPVILKSVKKVYQIENPRLYTQHLVLSSKKKKFHYLHYPGIVNYLCSGRLTFICRFVVP